MKYFYVIANPTREGTLAMAGFIKNYLEKLKMTCIVDAGTPKSDRDGYTYREQVSPEADCVIVLGGDGTLLQAAVDLAERDIPFLGINMGRLGFLAEVNRDGIESALQKLIRGEFTIEKRMMLLGRSYGTEGAGDEARALNDIVITRKGSLQIINFNIYVNGQLLHRFHGDGIIVATPTGSTQNRSIVLSSEDKVTVEIERGRDGEAQEVEAIFDGCHKAALRTGERIEIRKSQKTTGIVKLSQVSFLEVLHRKLSD